MKQSIRYPGATKLAKKLGIQPKRTPGGELGYTYTDDKGKKHYAIYIDTQSIKDKIDLIKKYNLKGIYFFALYGEEDPAIWPLIKKERAR